MKEEEKKVRRKKWTEMAYSLLGTLLLIVGVLYFHGIEAKAFASNAELLVDDFVFVESGKVVATSCTDGKGGTAVYNPDLNTLTLTNYTFKSDPRITEPEVTVYDNLFIYRMGSDFTLVLKGNNTIKRYPLQDNIGIKITDNCVIEGGGTLVSNVFLSSSGKSRLTIRDCNIQIKSPYVGIGAGELVVENADISVKSDHSTMTAWGNAFRVEKLTVTESNITAITPSTNCMSLWVSREINLDENNLAQKPEEKIHLSNDEIVTDEAGNSLHIEELSYGGRSWYVYTAKSAEEFAVNPRNSVARCVKITSRTRSAMQARIKVVEDLIAGIGAVTVESGVKIEEARRAYEQLSAPEKEKVVNTEILFQAETTYVQVKKQAEEEAKKLEEAKKKAEEEAKKKAEAETAKKKAEEKTGVISGTGNKKARVVKVKGKKYTIKTPRLRSVTSKSRRTIKVVWTPDRKCSGYQLIYSTNKKFKSKKSVWVNKAKTGKLTLKKLRSRRTYYVKLRAYRTIKGKRYYSYWSAVGKRKVK